MLSVKQDGIKYHFFFVFGMTRRGIEPQSPGPLANTLLIKPMKPYVCKKLKLYNCLAGKKLALNSYCKTNQPLKFTWEGHVLLPWKWNRHTEDSFISIDLYLLRTNWFLLSLYTVLCLLKYHKLFHNICMCWCMHLSCLVCVLSVSFFQVFELFFPSLTVSFVLLLNFPHTDVSHHLP